MIVLLTLQTLVCRITKSKFSSMDSKHSLAIRPKESEMIVIMEDIYEQILRHNAIKDSYISRAFTFNYLDIDDKYYIHNSKSLKVLRKLREKLFILNLITDKV